MIIALVYCLRSKTVSNGVAATSESATATLEIPRTVLDAAQMSAHELRRELALTLYAQNRLSLGKARELAGLSL